MTQGESQVRVLGDFGQARMTSRRLLSINEFANVCRTTPRTLRFYEQKGLFRPTKIDENNKYRFYDPKQARDFLKIRLLQNFHIPLKQISKTIKKNSAETYLEDELTRLKEEIREKEKEYKFLRKIKSFLFDHYLSRHSGEVDASTDSRIKEGGDSGRALPIKSGSLARMTNIENIFTTKTFGPFNLFCMKVEHGEYAKITDYIKTLWKEAKRLKLKCKPSEITFYLDNTYSPKNTPLEMALILRKPTSEESRSLPRHLGGVATRLLRGGIREKLNNEAFYFRSYPKTKTLAYDYNGPYEYLILVYQKLFSHIENQKIKLKGLVFEKYKYGPLNTKSKYDYQTTIGFPI